MNKYDFEFVTSKEFDETIGSIKRLSIRHFIGGTLLFVFFYVMTVSMILFL